MEINSRGPFPCSLVKRRVVSHVLLLVSFLLVDEAVAPEGRSAPAGVNHVHLVSAVRLRNAVGHVDAPAAAQSLVAAAPAEPLPGPGLDQDDGGHSHSQGQQQGDGPGRRGAARRFRRHLQVRSPSVSGLGLGGFHTQTWEDGGGEVGLVRAGSGGGGGVYLSACRRRSSP